MPPQRWQTLTILCGVDPAAVHNKFLEYSRASYPTEDPCAINSLGSADPSLQLEIMKTGKTFHEMRREIDDPHHVRGCPDRWRRPR